MRVALPEVAGVTHSYVRAGGLTFHVAEAGKGEPLLMLHGWPQHWYMWRHVIPELSDRYRVICPDLRGLGWTDAPGHGYEKETLANDMLGLMDALEIDRVKLVGHDWGGFTGFLMCLFQPRRFDAYLALGIVHPWIRPDPRRARRAWNTGYQWVLATPGLGSRLLRNRPDLVEAGLRGATRRPGVWTDEEVRCFSAVLQQPARARASAHYYRTFLVREAIPLVAGAYRDHRLEVRTRLIVGRDDPVCAPELLPGYEGHADRMDHRILEEVGHFMVEEAPDEILRELRSFF